MLRRTDKYLFLSIFGLLLFLNFNRHSKHGSFNYHGELYADKAGYHVFLPALFYYNFDANQFPENIDWKTGTGFKLDSNKGKVLTKYPVGVAILQLPFFSLGAVIDHFNGATQDLGYTVVQHKMIGLSTIFYFVLGLLLLFKSFDDSINARTKYLLLFLVVFGSNVFFYITRDAGLSHGYSFFIFSGLLYFLTRFLTRDGSWKSITLFVVFSVLGCLIRPINVVFIGLASLCFLIPYWKQLVHKKALVFKGILVAIPFVLLLLLPQLLYYKYAFGDWFAYSYDDERFLYWLNPKLARVWFAPANGLLLYSPIYLLFVLGLFQYWKVHKLQTVLIALLFLSVSYLYASWWTPGLGCGYGHRGFIEFMPFFSLPILHHLTSWKNKTWMMVASVIGLAYIILLVHFQYKYDGCWYGNGYWDWQELLLILGIK